tara:strand:- start:330 stop:665 length:336 start_codon:yes stop_codon:yes gene_type:complete
MKFNLKEYQKKKIQHVKDNPNMYAHENVGLRINVFQAILYPFILIRIFNFDYGIISIGVSLILCLIPYILFEIWQKRNGGTNYGMVIIKDIIIGYWTCLLLVPLIAFIINS